MSDPYFVSITILGESAAPALSDFLMSINQPRSSLHKQSTHDRKCERGGAAFASGKLIFPVPVSREI